MSNSLAGILADLRLIKSRLRGQGWDAEFHKDPNAERFNFVARDEEGTSVSGFLTVDEITRPPLDVVYRRLLHTITTEKEGAMSTEETKPADRTSVGAEEIEHRFGFHKATIEGANATLPTHREVRILFREFAEKLDALLVPGRAKSVAFTELENASMWSHKAIAETAPVVHE